MNVLVTGGAGFIGTNVALNFANLGHDVFVADNNDKSVNWAILKENRNIYTYLVDVKKLNWFVDIMNFDPFDLIVHCAAQTAATTSVIDPEQDFEDNVLTGFQVAELARKMDSQVIYTSTNKVYGSKPNELKIKELNKKYAFENIEGIDESFSIDQSGHTPYGISKLVTDLYLQEYHHVYGLDTTIFRMSCIYGNHQYGHEDQGWVAWIVRNILAGNKINIYGTGKQVRDVLNVKDLVALMNKAHQTKISGVFNVGGGKDNTLSVLELMDLVIPDYSNREYHDWRPMDQKVYISNINKVSTMFGWKPTITPKEGVDEMIKRFKK